MFKLHPGGDGIRASIRHNDREVWQAEIGGTDDKGVEPNVTLDVKQGDALRFIVDKRGNIGCDTTGWDPMIAYADGEKFQASASFCGKEAGRRRLVLRDARAGEIAGAEEITDPGPGVVSGAAHGATNR